MNNSNALAEIQSKYPNCNLLLPAATSVQINPFYKCSVMEVVADTAPSSGDIFSVGKVKTGEDGKGKAIYEEVFSPAKPLLMKLATAAGIQFHPEYTTVIRENTNTYVGKAYGAVRLPDGSYKTHMETKRICLDDEESKYRLEFMDKSIMGIHDWRASKAAAEMFKGEWKQETEPNQYGKYDKFVFNVWHTQSSNASPNNIYIKGGKAQTRRCCYWHCDRTDYRTSCICLWKYHRNCSL